MASDSKAVYRVRFLDAFSVRWGTFRRETSRPQSEKRGIGNRHVENLGPLEWVWQSLFKRYSKVVAGLGGGGRFQGGAYQGENVAAKGHCAQLGSG